uniref:Uncharacterized protein n=1 Tax=Amphimedon queenslandica TaxID=400682 RepID=A0A1X7VTD6_AMPQE
MDDNEEYYLALFYDDPLNSQPGSAIINPPPIEEPNNHEVTPRGCGGRRPHPTSLAPKRTATATTKTSGSA